MKKILLGISLLIFPVVVHAGNLSVNGGGTGSLVINGGATSSGGAQILSATVSGSNLGQVSGGNTSAYYPPVGVASTGNTQSVGSLTVHRSGTLANFCINMYGGGTQPGTGNLIFAVNVNNSDKALTVTIAAGAGGGETCDSNSGHNVALSAGDVLSVHVTNNASTSSNYWISTYMELQ